MRVIDLVLYAMGWSYQHPYAYFIVMLMLGFALSKLNIIWGSATRKDASLPKISFPFTLVFHLLFAIVLVATFYSVLDIKHQFGGNPLDRTIKAWLWVGPCILLNWFGKLDDVRNLSSRLKFVIIIGTWSVLLLLNFIQLYSDRNAYLNPENRISDVLLLVFGHGIGLLLTISLPLLDGLDGLYGSVAAIYLFPKMFGGIHCSDCCWSVGDAMECSDIWWYAILLVPFLAGFLIINFRGKARLGEAAVLPISFLIGNQFAINPSLSPQNNDKLWWGVMYVVSLVLYPLADFALVSFFRYRNGRSPFKGGHDHLHHRLDQLGWSKRKVVICLVAAFAWSQSAFYLIVINELDSPIDSTLFVILGILPLLYLFWRGYTKVNPYKSGAVDERGRP